MAEQLRVVLEELRVVLETSAESRAKIWYQ